LNSISKITQKKNQNKHTKAYKLIYTPYAKSHTPQYFFFIESFGSNFVEHSEWGCFAGSK